MRIGDKVKFTGHEYNLCKIFKYKEIFKDKELIIEDVILCSCNTEEQNKLKFKNIEGYYKQLFFKKAEQCIQ